MFKQFINFFWSSDDKPNAAGVGVDDPQQAKDSTSNSNEAGFSDFANKAAAQVVAPITNEFDYVAIQSLQKDGRILAKATVAAENADGSITIATCSTLIQTASGELVPPDRIASKCGHPGCGQVEATVLRCYIGGETRCYLHCRQIMVEDEKRIVCLEHLQQLLQDWDTWSEYDRARGILRLPSGAPPQPVAVKPEPHKPVFINAYNHGPQKHVE
jgi:hypothetical protein